ncbi:hypothetical protein IK146_01985 [Candidatus Saccharibacteria bacterium]|nr:hypothetical protein [Candidatus Saccharibacteria bacterium]
MANTKSEHRAIVYVVGAILVIVALAIFISTRLSAGPKPEISSLEIDESILTIIPKDDSSRLVFCITKTPSPSGCKWEETNVLSLSPEDTYYAFIKNIDTGAISNPKAVER